MAARERGISAGTVNVRVFPPLSGIAEPGRLGSVNVRVEMPAGMTARDLLRQLARRYGRGFQEALYGGNEGELRGYVNIFLNRHHLAQSELERELSDGDELILLPAYAGG